MQNKLKRPIKALKPLGKQKVGFQSINVFDIIKKSGINWNCELPFRFRVFLLCLLFSVDEHEKENRTDHRPLKLRVIREPDREDAKIRDVPTNFSHHPFRFQISLSTV
jgi:hypothetical protein